MTRFGLVQRAILNDGRSFASGLAWSLAALLTAIAARFALAPWIHGVPFITFFPVVLIASLLLGGGWGLAVTLASGAAANFLFFEPAFTWAVTGQAILATVTFMASAALLVATASMLRGAVREVDQRARREVILNAELQHRVKNNLAIVLALARQTAKTRPKPDEFYGAFEGRVVALAQAHDVLSSGQWEECHLPELPEAALKPFRGHGKITLAGPPCIIPPAGCVPLVLALHELGTNAVKYGALSIPTGQVSVTWTVDSGNLLLRWQETGGPAVAPPNRRGLGSGLLRKQTGLDAVTLAFDPGGVTCEIRIDGARTRDPVAETDV